MVGLKKAAVAAGVGIVGAGLWMAPGLGLGMPIVLCQTGNSMPKGWWIYDHAAPPEIGEVMVEREPKDFKLSWLMKRVVGKEGDEYCWRPDLGTHTLNGRSMPPPNEIALALGLRPWEGCRVLKAGEVVGYGDSPDSFDSRYRGITHESKLWGVYKPLWLSQG